jgi:hypothetical protein
MAIIGANKPTLLNQIKRQPTVDLQTLVKLVNQYEDLEVEDFRGYVSDVLLEQLKEAGRDPKEVQLWNQIMSAPRETPEDIQNVQRLVVTYINQFPKGPKLNEANERLRSLQAEMAEAAERQRRKADEEREQRDWEALERGNYSALAAYKNRYPNSVHMDELDDLMWTNTRNVMNQHSLNRYLNDWPLGRHAEEATRALNSFAEWDDVKRSGDLFLVDDYRDNHPDSPFITEVNSTYYKLRDEKLAEMKKNPSEFSKDDVERLIAADIFTQWQLIDEGLVTDESWETLQLDRDLFPNIQDYQREDPNIQAPADCTDIYLFGTPGTGKTCLLMGLTGANGQGYTLNMRVQGGPYASALQQYVNAGITPGRTFGRFVTTINGQVNETTRRGNIVSHRINLVEMSGEEFALRIAGNQDVAFTNMGVGATNLLANANRKVFFIIVDSTKDMVKVEYVEEVKDAEGNVIDERIRKKYISQLDILNKFVSLFELPENQEIMKRVDAIHFVVTKADMLGDRTVRLDRARDLLKTKYAGPVEQLKNYCRQTKRINYSTGYKPQVFTFSLGQFFLGDVFKFDTSETIKIVDTIRTVTGGVREKSFWDRVKDALN